MLYLLFVVENVLEFFINTIDSNKMEITLEE